VKIALHEQDSAEEGQANRQTHRKNFDRTDLRYQNLRGDEGPAPIPQFPSV
jgi:hypothetical protein